MWKEKNVFTIILLAFKGANIDWEEQDIYNNDISIVK